MSHVGQSGLYAEERYEPPLRRGTPWKYSPPLKASEYHLIDLCAGCSVPALANANNQPGPAPRSYLRREAAYHLYRIVPVPP